MSDTYLELLKKKKKKETSHQMKEQSVLGMDEFPGSSAQSV